MDYQATTLKNGLRVITVSMRSRETAAVAIWVKTGGRYEPQKISGVSHFLEHMLFKGTRKRTTRQIKEEIEGVGGVLNAFTGEEVTCYFAKLLKQHYGKALDVLSDMVNHATLAPAEIQKERTVVLEEIKMYRDLPSHYVHELMGEILWPDQALGRPIAGTQESVSALTRKQISDFKNRMYHPKNIVVSVAGPIDHHEVLNAAQKYFPEKVRGSLSKFAKATTHQRAPKSLFLEKQTEQTHFVIALHGFSRFDPDRYKLGLLNVILGANMSSRLFEEVREKRGLAYEIRSGLTFYNDTGAVMVSAGVENKKTPTAIRVILRELEKMKEKPVTEGELRRAKDYFMSQLYMALEDTLEHLLWAGERAIDLKEPPDRDQIRRSIESVTVKEIQEVAKRLFVTRNLNLSLIGPMKEKVQKQIRNDFSFSRS